MDIITRKLYADKIDSWLNKGLIIVLTGQRRVGKSFILKDFANRHSNEPSANIIFIDKEKRDFNFIKTHEELDSQINKHFDKNKHNYILIDEIQEIDGWENAVRSYRTEESTNIIITGSNSQMFSSELGTLLGGRYIEIYIQPLSYEEFLEFHNLNNNDDTLFKYLNYGGLPGLRAVGLDDEYQVAEYLKSVFNTVILKDIVERHNIRNIPFLRKLTEYLADTTSKPLSATNISKYMKSVGQDVSVTIVIDYIQYLCESYLIDCVKRYNLHGKKMLESQQKTYFGDVGLRNMIVGGERAKDIEKVIENIVYQHLVRLGYQVTVGELRSAEIDFVCRKNNKTKYVQAAYLIANEETETREFGNLAKINDDYPKYVISATPLVKTADYNGITHLGLREFLLKGL